MVNEGLVKLKLVWAWYWAMKKGGCGLGLRAQVQLVVGDSQMGCLESQGIGPTQVMCDDHGISPLERPKPVG